MTWRDFLWFVFKYRPRSCKKKLAMQQQHIPYCLQHKYNYSITAHLYQRCRRGHKARGHGHKKNSETKAKDTSANALQNKRSQKFFSGDLQKTTSSKNFFRRSTKFQKIVWSSSREQANFRRLEASRPRPRTWPSRPGTSKCVLEAKDVLEDSTSD